MKCISTSDIFVQGVPVRALVVTEIEDNFAAKLIADRIVRAATADEIAAADESDAAPITAETYDTRRDAGIA